jgi:RNA polymerase sigma factor for flagellar operon FliA
MLESAAQARAARPQPAAPDRIRPKNRIERLVREHLGLVHEVVNRVAAGFPRHVERDELIDAGRLGLVEAARRYDPSTGVPFERYAAIRIRGAVLDSTRTRDWVSRLSGIERLILAKPWVRTE